MNDTSTSENLTELLVRDFSQGRYEMAIAHFLRLKASGASMPALIARSCEQFLRGSRPLPRPRPARPGFR